MPLKSGIENLILEMNISFPENSFYKEKVLFFLKEEREQIVQVR